MIRKIDLLPNGEVRLSYYNIFAKKFSEVMPIKNIISGSMNETPTYYTFKIKGRYLYYLVNKNGKMGYNDLLYNQFLSILITLF